MKKCIFFDRDGIVNVPPPDSERYVKRVADFSIMPAFVDALRVALDKGYLAILITNQAGISRGWMTDEAVREIHDTLLEHVRKEGLDLHGIYYCPWFDSDHPDRKPNPGMILRAAEEHGIDLKASWMIGDSEKDVTAGRRAGCRTVRVYDKDEPSQADVCLTSMDELPGWMEKGIG